MSYKLLIVAAFCVIGYKRIVINNLPPANIRLSNI